MGVAVLACRFLGPRPRLRRLARQPGTVATACLTLALPIEAAPRAAGWALRQVVDRAWPPQQPPALGGDIAITADQLLYILTGVEAGPLVLAGWLLLAAPGLWRSEPTWVDRAGRALGVAWIAFSVADRLLQGY